jgi:hypothetical protein
MILGALFNRMPVALWILAIGPNITVIHRILYTWKQTKDAPADAPARTDGAGSRGTQVFPAPAQRSAQTAAQTKAARAARPARRLLARSAHRRG